jgi:hypothetical protein
MKRFLKIRRLFSGQALIIFFLILCLITGSVIASIHLHRMNLSLSSDIAAKPKHIEGTCIKESFPCNRYSNEVLMY